RWNRHVDVREFIQLNYTLYEGNDSFLAGPTEATSKLWEQVMQLSKEERERGGMWDMDTKVASTITSHDAGYLDKDLE
ncbi:formate acetyltransferase, partial [Xanthomonas citri pv. citri]|nr:formate acetyltransferase [Xanthomonas citri pv. citri]